MTKTKKSKKKIKLKKNGFKRLIIILLFLYLFVSLFLYLFNLPIKNIIIKGTEVLSDHEIITTARIEDYPSIFRTSTRVLKRRLKENPLIKDVEMKKSLLGILTIDIEENKPIFYNNNNDKVVLENGQEIDKDQNFLKIPTLINFVPDKIYKSFLKNIDQVDYHVIKLISEIEYAPTGTTESESDRFLLRMNDENTVYINLLNMKNLNLYLDMFTAFSDERGTLYLDSSNSVNFFFQAY